MGNATAWTGLSAPADCLAGRGDGDVATAYSTFEQAAKIGDRFDEADLVALARQGRGRALIRSGEVAGPASPCSTR